MGGIEGGQTGGQSALPDSVAIVVNTAGSAVYRSRVDTSVPSISPHSTSNATLRFIKSSDLGCTSHLPSHLEP